MHWYISSRIFENVIANWTFCVQQFSVGRKRSNSYYTNSECNYCFSLFSSFPSPRSFFFSFPFPLLLRFWSFSGLTNLFFDAVFTLMTVNFVIKFVLIERRGLKYLRKNVKVVFHKEKEKIWQFNEGVSRKENCGIASVKGEVGGGDEAHVQNWKIIYWFLISEFIYWQIWSDSSHCRWSFLLFDNSIKSQFLPCRKLVLLTRAGIREHRWRHRNW